MLIAIWLAKLSISPVVPPVLFINLRWHDVAAELAAPELYQVVVKAGDRIAENYENREFSRAIREIMALADLVNQYIDEKKPWVLAKQAGMEQQVQAIGTMGSEFVSCIDNLFNADFTCDRREGRRVFKYNGNELARPRATIAKPSH